MDDQDQVVPLLQQILKELKTLNNPAMKMSIDEKAQIAVAALHSGDKARIRKAKRAINPR